jgi:hypothetical protein
VKLPVDTAAIQFLCAIAPEQVVDFETKQPRVDESGQALYSVQLLALADGEANIIPVKVAGRPNDGVRQGNAVKVVGLVAQPWAMGDRSGVAFRATRIEAASVAAKA